MADGWFGEVSEVIENALRDIVFELQRFNDREEVKLNISGFVMNINERR